MYYTEHALRTKLGLAGHGMALARASWFQTQPVCSLTSAFLPSILAPADSSALASEAQTSASHSNVAASEPFTSAGRNLPNTCMLRV